MVATEMPDDAPAPAGESDGVSPTATPLLPPSPRSGRRSSVGSGPRSGSSRPSGSGPLTARNMERLRAQQGEDPLCNVNKLRAVFDGMAAATHGRITLDQLPFVLVGSEVAASPKEIEDTIAELLPDADDGDALIDYQQVETIYMKLCQDAQLPPEEPAAQPPVRPPAPWRRAWGWLRRQRQQRSAERTAYEKHMRPTTRLLLVILATATAISCGMVAFAIVMIFDHSVDDVKNNVLRQVISLRQGLEVSGYSMPLNLSVARMRTLASTLGTLVEGLGYQGSKGALSADLMSQQMELGAVLDGWFVGDLTARATLQTQLLAGCLQFLAQTEGVSTTVRLINQLNPTLPTGREVVLSRGPGTAAPPQYATQLRYLDQCQTANCTTAGRLDAASLAALNGSTGVLFGTDYRPTAVVAGYTYVPGPRLGLVYNTELAGLRDWFAGVAAAVVVDVNAAANLTSNVTGKRNADEYVLAKWDAASGKALVLAAERGCDAACLRSADLAGSMLILALNGSNGTAETRDLSGVNVTAAYGPLPVSGLVLAVQRPEVDFLAGVYAGSAAGLDAANGRLNSTEELQLAVADNTSVNGFRFLTDFVQGCNGTCGYIPDTSPFMAAAVADCSAGTMQDVLDYRGVEVLAGYTCVPSLRAGVAMKMDYQTVTSWGLSLVTTILEYETDVRFANSTYEMYGAVLKPGVEVARTSTDFTRINARKREQDCPNSTCTGPVTFLLLALSGQTGVLKGLDYHNHMVYGAYTYVPELRAGIVVKVDTSEAESDSILTAGALAGCCGGALLGSMLLLAWLTNKRLQAMDEAWDEGKEAIVREKQQFRDVIEAMYPAQVAQRLLAGDQHIVYHVPTATVFFSDIYEFTTATNAISPEELIQFMGYTFGTMDAAAEHFNVHKVKTMGDAFLGVAGLPGSESPSGNTALDVLVFASCCAQLFSTRYLHPDSAAVLGTVAKTLFGPRPKAGKEGQGPEGSEEIGSRTHTVSQIQFDNPSISPSGPDCPGVQCVMRYGVASGPITAGVLQGKTPLFDIWGKTVNLASRMESSGVPGRIQLSESVHQAVITEKDQPFTFDAQHKVTCKGFGSVPAYFISSCKLPPPKALLVSRRIQPNLGRFFFDNAVPGFRSTTSKTTGSSGHTSSASGRSTPRSAAHAPAPGSLPQ